MLGVALTLRREDSPTVLPFYALTMTEKNWYEGKTQGSVFIAPRGDHSLWLGTMQLESYDKNIGLSHPAVQRMLQECQTIYPPLKNINQDDLRVTVGIRPMRRGGPRLERDSHYPFLIHNYGHGHFGVNASWGCASTVLRILETKSPQFSSKY
ncbi:D-amino-acid oxidase [Exaiptasia diaphana]|nr:D-amino-acid oxidase [Exaiptasia diaphana]